MCAEFAPRAFANLATRDAEMRIDKTVGLKRQRLLDAVNHRTPDRVPMDFGGSAVTGMHVSCVAKLRDHYGLARRRVKVIEPFQMLGLIEDDLREAMGIDVTPLSGRTTMFGFENRDWRPWVFNGLEVLVPSGYMPKDGFFFDAIIRQKPIDLDHLDPFDNTEQYVKLTDAELDGIEADARAVSTGEYAVFASLVNTNLGDIAFVPGPDLIDPKGVRDVAEWYMLTASQPDVVHKIFERQVEVGLANLAKINARVGEAIDVIFLCGADFGTQTSSFCSVRTFDALWRPHYAALCDWIHKNTTWKVFKHSCGSSERFFESMIDAGIDIINPVQCSAKGMDPRVLKDKYKGRLVFWGGGVDTQRTLPFGTPADVRAEVLERCEIFAEGGGFVFTSIHNVQAGTPVENIVAMIDAVQEFNGEPRASPRRAELGV